MKRKNCLNENFDEKYIEYHDKNTEKGVKLNGFT